MDDLVKLIYIPIFTTVVGGLLVHIIDKYFVVFGSLSFFGYPAVKGSYKFVYLDNTYPDEYVELKQRGSRVSGIVNDSRGNTFSLVGNVTRSRYITYYYKSKSNNLNAHGSGLLKLNKKGDGANGYVLFVSESAEEPGAAAIKLEKQK